MKFVLFGSRAYGGHREDSDYDVVYLSDIVVDVEKPIASVVDGVIVRHLGWENVGEIDGAGTVIPADGPLWQEAA